MKPYESIETLYIRSKETNKLDFTAIRNPEWCNVRDWMLTEKIDGTNIRVIVTNEGISVQGRTANAQLPPGIKDVIVESFDHTKILDHFKAGKPNAYLPEAWTVTFYGEGYGPGIKGSEVMAYKPQGAKKGFRCFDIKFGDVDSNHWASTREWEELCLTLAVPRVNIIGWLRDPLPQDREDAYNMMESFLPRSYCALEDGGTQKHGEGIVARPEFPLFDRWGSRLIWKLTKREF